MSVIEAVLTSVKVVALFCLMMSNAVELRRDYWTVQLIHLEAITVATVRMLGLLVQQVSSFRTKVH